MSRHPGGSWHEDASTTLRVYAHAIRRRDQESAAAMQRLLDALH